MRTADSETYNTFARPGDADFSSFPKHVPEDCVCYFIYIIPTSGTDETHTRSRLKEFQSSAFALVRSLLSDYIWQHDSFNLSLERDEASKQLCLRGRTEFGDSIADEWLIVYLLRELSKKFDEAWIRVVDADGEFLLVEAANVLPKWLNPEIADHRVWINKGQLRIIPLEQASSTGSAKSRTSSRVAQTRGLSLSEAVAYISRHHEQLIHSSTMESEAFFRLRSYPAQIASTLHNAPILIPRKLAYILHRKPEHISPAVDAFYLRDPVSLGALQASHRGGRKLNFPPDDLVTVSVKFTRVGYAQLRSQEFHPPPAWATALVRAEGGDTKAHERATMGMKVACGFEMLIGDSKNKDKKSTREVKLLLDDIESGDEPLPSDAEIMGWPRVEDDESWLDVNFEDFENELAGRGRSRDSGAGQFGDKGAQENLRRIVEKFEQFLNDEDAGVDGAGFGDDMDYDDDDSDTAEDGSRGSDEDRAASPTGEDFVSMMKHMMGKPGHEDMPIAHGSSRIKELDSDVESLEDEDIKVTMDRIEAELRETGVLDLDSKSMAQPAISDDGPNVNTFSSEADPRLLFAQNLLESFKGQAGMSGPAGNLMSSLGLSMPRDEPD